MALTKIDDRGLKTPIDLLDNEKIRLGTGNDLEIYHDATDSHLDNNTGDLYLTTTGSGDDINITSADDVVIKTNGGTQAIVAVGGAESKLYHNGSKKIETTSSGATISGALTTNVGSDNSDVGIFTGGDTSRGLKITTSATSNTNDAVVTLNAQTATHGTLAFAVANGSEKMRIDSSGNVGIGTTSPRSLLDLGAGSGDGSLSSTLSQYQIMFEAPQGTDDYGRNIGWSVGTNGLTAAINAVDVGASDSTALAFITGTNSSVAERMRILSNGGITFNGDTAAANALDDYEEGTFTPQLAGFSSISYHRQDGFYTKIGRQVWMHVYLYVYQATGNSNKIRITNLPFTSSSANSGYIRHGGALWYQNDTFKDSFNSESKPHVYIDQGSTEARFVSQAGSELNGEDTYLGGGANNRYIICGLQMIV